MATRRVELGLTGETVKANVAMHRKRQGLTLRQLAERLAETSRPLSHNAVSEIERGARRVDVDDLTALAIALGVSPVALLMPDEMRWAATASVRITGSPSPISGDEAWQWMRGDELPASFPGKMWDFIIGSRPQWTLKFEMPAPVILVDGQAVGGESNDGDD